MSIRLLVPAIGVIGIVGGMVGGFVPVTGNKEEVKDTPSNSRRDLSPSIGPLLISLKCSQDPDRWDSDKDSYTLNIQGEVSREDLVKLQEKNPVGVGVSFELLSGTKKEAIRQFSDKKANKIFTTIQYWNRGGLNVTLGDMSGDDRYIDSQQFWCKSEDKQISWVDTGTGERIIGYSDMKTVSEDKLNGSLKGSGEMKVVVDNCEKSGNESISTCDLSLTDRDSKKWKAKLAEKIKFDSPQ